MKKIGLIGLGAIGTPIAHKLYQCCGDGFFLIANEKIKLRLQSQIIHVNGELFNPQIYSATEAHPENIGLVIVCIKNYDLLPSLHDIKPFVNQETLILPLQNGIYSYEFFKNNFPDNLILRGYVQGPNTEIIGSNYTYQNPGELHLGSENDVAMAKEIVRCFSEAGIPTYYESEIKTQVWKKWMLNVAGNSVTALTGADYSYFRNYPELQDVCRQAMQEFLGIAEAEGVHLTDTDVQKIIDYYVSYNGNKKTSMLLDVINERKTENDYLAGTAVELGDKHHLSIPTIRTLYYLIKTKEKIYTEIKEQKSGE